MEYELDNWPPLYLKETESTILKLPQKKFQTQISPLVILRAIYTITLILHSLFKKTRQEEMSPSSSYDANSTQMPKADTDGTKTETTQNATHWFFLHMDAKNL
jgi:hypothetical protein